jgi:hypothetical protein
MSLRGELWTELIGNDLRINSMMFENFKNEHFTFEASVMKEFSQVLNLD